MRYSRRYREIKAKIPNNKHYPLPEGLNFLQSNNFEKLKNIKVSFALNWANQKTTTPLKSRIILPYPEPPKGKIAVVKDGLPVEMTNNLTEIEEVELLSVEEVHQKILAEKTNKIRKKTQWGFEKLLIHPQNEKKFRLPEKLPPKLFGLISKKVLLTKDTLEAVSNFRRGEQAIR